MCMNAGQWHEMWGAGGSQFLVRKVLQWKEVLPEALGGSETLGEAGLRVTMVTTRAEGVPGCEPGQVWTRSRPAEVGK